MEDLSITGHLGRGTMQEVSTESSVRVRQCQADDASALARLHVENLSGRLSIPLMEAYYRACMRSGQNFCICAEVNGATVGFVGLISDRMQILKSLLRRYGFTVFASIFARPFLLVAFFRHLWSWLKIPIRSQEMRLPRWEYRPVIVSKEYRGRGVAQLLFAAAEEMLEERGVNRVLVQVAKTNVAALRAYEKAGFCPAAERSSMVFMVKNLTGQPLTPVSSHEQESWPFWKMVPRFEPEYSFRDFLLALSTLIPHNNCESVAFEQFPMDCLFLRSGRECLYAILKALKLRGRARVGVPLYCCPSVFEAIVAAGHVPVFLDVNLDTYSLDLDYLESSKNGLDAVVIIHTFGYPTNLAALRTCLSAREIPIIEDCAHALFSEYHGRMLGTHTQASFFSFGLHKPAAVGGGGMAVFNDSALAKSATQVVCTPAVENRLRELRHAMICGSRALAYQRVIYGALMASPFGRIRDQRTDPSEDAETIEGKIVYSLANMRRCDRILLEGRFSELRKELPALSLNTQRLRVAIHGAPLEMPEEPLEGKWNHFLLPVRYRDGKRRTAGRQFLMKHGVDTAPLYQNCVRDAFRFGYDGGCPNAEKAAQTVCTIPHHARLSNSEIELIGESLRKSTEVCV